MKVTIEMPANALIPTIHLFRDYFNEKYPCTDEDNDGSEMPVEDLIKYAIFNNLIDIYNGNMVLYETEYDKLVLQVVEAATIPKPTEND